MDTFLDYYRILQVHQNAEPDVIEATYKRLCKKYHPDVCRLPDAEARMKEINVAYDVLADATKRAQYTSEWLKHNSSISTVPSLNKRVSDSYDARKVVEQYFFFLSEALYQRAYELLSAADKKHVTMRSFLEWQKSVSEVYAVRECNPRQSRHYDDFEIDEHSSCAAKRFDIEILEENKLNRTTSRYTFHKFVVREGDTWRIYLGYRDLNYIANQFKFIANSRGEEAAALNQWDQYRGSTDVKKGLPNYRGFMERAAAEMYRFKRYRHPFAVSVLQIEGGSSVSGGAYEKLTTQAGHTLRKLLRGVDILAYMGNDRYVVLLAQIDKENGRRVVERLARRVQQELFTHFDVKTNVRFVFKQYAGEDMEALLLTLQQRLPPRKNKKAN